MTCSASTEPGYRARVNAAVITTGRLSAAARRNRDRYWCAWAKNAPSPDPIAPPVNALVTNSAAAVPRTSGAISVAHACIVEVDPGTGHVEIQRYLVVEDCGALINPAIVDGQVRGVEAVIDKDYAASMLAASSMNSKSLRPII